MSLLLLIILWCVVFSSVAVAFAGGFSPQRHRDLKRYIAFALILSGLALIFLSIHPLTLQSALRALVTVMPGGVCASIIRYVLIKKTT